MVSRSNQEIPISLDSPIQYRGKQFDHFFLTGPPFRGVGSAYQETRSAIGLDYLATGNPNVTLDTQMIGYLKLKQ